MILLPSPSELRNTWVAADPVELGSFGLLLVALCHHDVTV